MGSRKNCLVRKFLYSDWISLFGNDLSNQFFHFCHFRLTATAENPAKVSIAIHDKALRDAVEVADLQKTVLHFSIRPDERVIKFELLSEFLHHFFGIAVVGVQSDYLETVV